jgi:acyl-CoA reductase-like NAD-dependent aldehyde dehydrogenase
VGPVINRDAVDKIMSYIDIGRKDGATLACGGNV